jgi:hypothetical protein
VNRPHLIALAILLPSVLLAAVLVLVGVAQSRQRQLGPDHPGATASTPTLPPVTPQPYPWPTFTPATERLTGRHHEETVEPVPADWMPLPEADRLRALERTRIIPRFEAAPGHKAGGA